MSNTTYHILRVWRDETYLKIITYKQTPDFVMGKLSYSWGMTNHDYAQFSNHIEQQEFQCGVAYVLVKDLIRDDDDQWGVARYSGRIVRWAVYRHELLE